MVTKLLVCLANSYKEGGRCVAGKDSDGTWFRPVGRGGGGAVSKYERQYILNREPRMLDRISIVLSRRCGEEFQRENWLVDSDACWLYMGQAGWNEAFSLTERPESLWLNGYRTERGVNNCVPVARKSEVRDSLKFIHVDEVGVTVSPRLGGKRRVRVSFYYNGVEYMLPVTDPEFLKKWQVSNERINREREYRLGESLLTVSLARESAKDKENLHKLIAGIIERGDPKLAVI
ncbi:dual OB domain-containing protein [Nocardia asiatica]|uniref:dual OB domain-containing protein n=1 Tax=Nocardia asiatica TaxID=209252 RepID=UPI002456EF36|nr:hypothetical protein [Nocardia asiatica]